MADIKTLYRHSDGRVCTYDADDHNYWFGIDPARPSQSTCMRPHLDQARVYAEKINDRGPFGMPGLGSTAAGFDVTHAPHMFPGGITAHDIHVAAPGAPMPSGTASWNQPLGMLMVEDESDGSPMTYPSKEAELIVTRLMPEFTKLCLDKNLKYAEVQDGYALGDKGIIPDLNRKLGILVDRLWNGNPTVGEDTDEVILDMIGHLFLMLALRRS